jgi:hypothetical protein
MTAARIQLILSKGFVAPTMWIRISINGTMLYQSIEIGTGIKIGIMSQPNILVSFTQRNQSNNNLYN